MTKLGRLQHISKEDFDAMNLLTSFARNDEIIDQGLVKNFTRIKDYLEKCDNDLLLLGEQRLITGPTDQRIFNDLLHGKIVGLKIVRQNLGHSTLGHRPH